MKLNMKTLERETDPIKLAAMIAESERQSLIWQQEDKMINAFLSGTAPEQIENKILKQQINVFIQSGATDLLKEMKVLREQIQPLSKALASKVVAGKKISKKMMILEQFRASQLLK